MIEIRCRLFAELDAATLYEILRLRTNVFVVEQRCPYPELDGVDTQTSTRHVWAQEDGGIASYARLAREADGWRVGRVCTAVTARGRGLAAAVLEKTLSHTGDGAVMLHAQQDAKGLYERFGFQAEGAPFDEDGIAHVLMRRG